MSRDEQTAYWRGRVDEQAHSGMTAAAFCRDHHLKVEQFYRWRRRFRYQERDNEKTESFLQLIPSSKQLSQHSGIRLHVSPALYIELERGFDPDTLRTAIDVLSGK
jgi:transposase-like protein